MLFPLLFLGAASVFVGRKGRKARKKAAKAGKSALRVATAPARFAARTTARALDFGEHQEQGYGRFQSSLHS